MAQDAFPDFVKTASSADRYGDANTPNRCFADIIARRWPFHTKAATWQSALELAAIPEVNPIYVDRIKTAATVHQIAPEIYAIFDSMSKTASVDAVEYGLTIVDANGKATQMFPLRNATEIEKAASYLCEHKDSMRLIDRQQFAMNIIKQAEVHGVVLNSEIADSIHKQAGLGECTTDMLLDAIQQRVNRLPREYGESLKKLADGITDRLSLETRRKVATMLDGFDEETGLNKRYGIDLERPEDVLFNITKHAVYQAEQGFVQLANGDVYEKQAFAALSPHNIRTWLGDVVADDTCDIAGVDCEKLAEVVAILPRPDAQRFSKMAQKNGIKPL